MGKRKFKEYEEVTIFRRNMIALREALGMTQSELAHLADCQASNINEFEAGKRSGMTIGKGVRIAKALGVPFPIMFHPQPSALQKS